MFKKKESPILDETELGNRFLKTNKGKQIVKRFYQLLDENKTLKKQNQKLEEKIIWLSTQCSELQEKLESSNVDVLSKEEEAIARDLMEQAVSIYKGQKPSKYLYSAVDDSGREIRIYTSQVKGFLEELADQPFEEEKQKGLI